MISIVKRIDRNCRRTTTYNFKSFDEFVASNKDVKLDMNGELGVTDTLLCYHSGCNLVTNVELVGYMSKFAADLPYDWANSTYCIYRTSYVVFIDGIITKIYGVYDTWEEAHSKYILLSYGGYKNICIERIDTIISWKGEEDWDEDAR